MNYALAGKYANAELLAAETVNLYKRAPEDLRSLEDVVAFEIYCLHLLVQSQFPKLLRLTEQIGPLTDLLRTLLARKPETYPRITFTFAMVDALHLLSRFMMFGDGSDLEKARERINTAKRLSAGAALEDSVVSYLSTLMGGFLRTHSRTILSDVSFKLPPEYLRLLTESAAAVYNLWPPQIEAIHRGLLTSKRFAVQLPPSAGKTLLAELKIASILMGEEDALAIYVVPLNALARQIQKDLQQRLRLSPVDCHIKVLTGTYEIPDEDLKAVKKENVIITTPEKLDGLLRSREKPDVAEMFDRCRLLIFDEAQTITSGRRGVTYELLIARVRRLLPEAQILLLTAVCENIEDLAKWLDGQWIYYDWKPTRTYWAVWPVDEDLIFEGQWKITGYHRSPSLRKDVIKLALDLQQQYENILILVPRRDMAERYAEDMADAVASSESVAWKGDELSRLRVLSGQARKRIHPSCRLAQMAEYGVAYHHAELPSEIKSQIEDYLAEGVLKFVVSTTTLAAGMNLPIRCVILPTIYLGANPMTPFQLRNIIGRAGRAHVSTSGHVVVCRKSDFVRYEERWYPFEQYCFSPPPGLLTVTSALGSALEEEPSYDRFQERQALDSQILAYLDEALEPDSDQPSALARNTFLCAREPDKQTELSTLISSRLEAMSAEPMPLVTHGSVYSLTTFGNSIRVTGLGTWDAGQLLAHLLDIVNSDPDFFNSLRIDNALSEQKIKTLVLLGHSTLENLFDTYGFRRECKGILGTPISALKRDVSTFLSTYQAEESIRKKIESAILDFDTDFVWRWINGSSIPELSRFYLDREVATQRDLDQAITRAIHKVERLNVGLRWTLFALRNILDYLEDEAKVSTLSPEFDNLSYYLRYGVNHPIAVYLMDYVRWDSRSEALMVCQGLPGELSYRLDRGDLVEVLQAAGEVHVLERISDEERANQLWLRIASLGAS